MNSLNMVRAIVSLDVLELTSYASLSRQKYLLGWNDAVNIMLTRFRPSGPVANVESFY